MVIEVRKTCVYITLNGWVYYIDDSNEQITVERFPVEGECESDGLAAQPIHLMRITEDVRHG